MKLHSLVVGLTALLLVNTWIPAAADEEAMRQRLQRIFAHISDECRGEIQGMYASGGQQVSTSCTNEYRQAMAKDLGDHPPSKEEAEMLQQAANQQRGADSGQGQAQGQAQEQEQTEKERDLSEEPDPTMYILGFVVAFLAGIGGYIYYVNSKIPPGMKRKKLSKKKEMKKKRQEQNILGK